MIKHKLVGSFITEDQDYQRFQAAVAKESAKRKGLDLEIAFAEGNPVLQIRQLFRVIHAPEGERPIAIIVEPIAGDGYERVARNAVRAGIGWVLINARVPYVKDLRNEYPELPISSVTNDQVEIGQIQAQQFKSLLPNGGSMLYIQGPSDSAGASERLKGMKEGIKGTRIEVMNAIGDWTEEGGEKAVETWLRLKTTGGLSIEKIKLDLVGCQNDSLAEGARRALQKHKPEWAHLPFTGCDGLPDGGQRMVKTGRLAATIINHSAAGPAVELVANFLNENQPVPESEVLTPESYPPIEQISLPKR